MTWTARFLFSTWLFVLASGVPVLAAERTVVLTIPKMSEPACQVSVTEALLGVRGVRKVTAAYATKRAYVTFDDGLADLQSLKKATAEAGYPVADSAEASAR